MPLGIVDLRPGNHFKYTNAPRNTSFTVVRSVEHRPVGCPGNSHVTNANGAVECWAHCTPITVKGFRDKAPSEAPAAVECDVVSAYPVEIVAGVITGVVTDLLDRAMAATV